MNWILAVSALWQTPTLYVNSKSWTLSSPTLSEIASALTLKAVRSDVEWILMSGAENFPLFFLDYRGSLITLCEAGGVVFFFFKKTRHFTETCQKQHLDHTFPQKYDFLQLKSAWVDARSEGRLSRNVTRLPPSWSVTSRWTQSILSTVRRREREGKLIARSRTN